MKTKLLTFEKFNNKLLENKLLENKLLENKLFDLSNIEYLDISRDDNYAEYDIYTDEELLEIYPEYLIKNIKNFSKCLKKMQNKTSKDPQENNFLKLFQNPNMQNVLDDNIYDGIMVGDKKSAHFIYNDDHKALLCSINFYSKIFQEAINDNVDGEINVNMRTNRFLRDMMKKYFNVDVKLKMIEIDEEEYIL